MPSHSTGCDVARALGGFFEGAARCEALCRQSFQERFSAVFPSMGAPRQRLANLQASQRGLPARVDQEALLREGSRRAAMETVR
eukprot:5715136-Pyramimonas_sp.AAC.1